MVLTKQIRAAAAGFMACTLLASPVRALVSLNDGDTHLYVTATGSAAYDSNIFARADGQGDFILSAGLILEYARRAGAIGINATMAVNASRFGDNTTQNFNDPAFKVEFLKSGGRTTGSLKLGAAYVSEADAVIGERTQSWNYLSDLNFKYPVIERYSFSGELGYTDRVYDHPSSLTDLETFTAGADLLYALTSTRDLVAGYEFRRSDTSANSSYDDHSFTAGVSGRILPKLSGSVRAGYEVRTPRGSSTDGDYRGLTASASVTWTLSQRLKLTGLLNRDNSVTANNQSVNTTSGEIALQETLNRKLAFNASLGGGRSRYLNALEAGRHDEYLTWGTGLKYTMNDHVSSSLDYLFTQNWSTISLSDFTRHTITLSISSRW